MQKVWNKLVTTAVMIEIGHPIIFSFNCTLKLVSTYLILVAFLMIIYSFALLFGRKYDNVTIKTFILKFCCVDVLNKIAHASGETHL